MRIYIAPADWRGGILLPQRAALGTLPPARRAAYALEGTLARAHYGTAALTLTFGERGKPEILPPPGWTGTRFCHSIAHCDGAAAVAVDTAPVGVDIEPCDRPLPAAVAERWFTAAERAYIGGDARRALEVWVMREAYGKHSGAGIQRGETGAADERCGTRRVGGWLVGFRS